MSQKKGTVIALAGMDSAGAIESAEFDLGEASRKPLFQRLAYSPRISLNGLLIACLCTLLLVFVGFLPISIPSPLNLGASVDSYDQLQMIRYTLQIPIALFIAAFLGPFLGGLSIFLYLAIGLTAYPLFANGGGLHYITEPGFGYLLGMFVATISLGQSFYQTFQKEGSCSRSVKMFKKVLSTVLMVHVLGIAYLVGLTLAQQIPMDALPGWILRLSVEPLPYDLLATAVLLGLVRQVRLALLWVLY